MADSISGSGRLDARVDDGLVAWAAAGSSPRGFDQALRDATEARLLRVAIGPSYGSAVERGLESADAEAALALAALEAADHRQHEAKRLALHDHASSASTSLVGAMVRAALDHEALRLGSRDGVRDAARRRTVDGPPRSAAVMGTMARVADLAERRPSR